jgi:hypothetical protein
MMALQRPIAIYTAGTDLEAHCVREMLMNAGIEAAVIEDESRAAVWLLGLLPQIHGPKVFVEQADAERARPLLAEYERRLREEADDAGQGPLIHVVCEECRRTTTFSASRRGRVEICSHCGAFVDVGDDPGFDDWNVAANDESA